MNKFLLGVIVSAITSASLLSAAEPPATIVDQAASSADIRSRLIAEYESSTNVFHDDRLLAVAVSYAYEDKYDRAKLVYAQFLKDHPAHVRALRGIGTVCALQEHYDEAIGYLKKAWSLGDVDSLQKLAVLYWGTKNYDQFRDLLPSLRAHEKENVEIVDCLMAYSLSKEPLDETLLLEALNTLPDRDLLLRNDTAQLVASAANRLKTPELNNKTFQTILHKIIRGYLADPTNFPKKRLIAVGEAYSCLMENSKAEAIYNEILKDDPDNGGALLGLGMVNIYQHKPQEAIEHLRKALKLGERDALRNLGAAYFMAGDFEGMKDLIPSFMERKAENFEILNTLFAYCLKVKPPDKELFYKAIEGLTDGQILRRDDTADIVILGLKLFGDEKRAGHLLELKNQQKKGVRA